jgi:drug/metabolite transporter, DME family
MTFPVQVRRVRLDCGAVAGDGWRAGQTDPVSGQHAPPPTKRIAVGAVVAAAVLFGTSGTARELGPESASSLTVGAARITMGSVVLWAVVVANRRRERLPTAAVLRPLGPLLAIGGLGVALYTPLFFVAVDRTGVAVGTVVAIASGPFFAAGLDWRFRRIRPTVTWLRGTAVTVFGVGVLVAAVDASGAAIDVVGVAAALAAGLGYATYSVSSKATMERGLTSTAALAIPFTIGVVVVLALSIRESPRWLTTTAGVAMALYLGVVATGLAYVLFGFGLRRLTSATAVTLVLAEPLTAALLAAVVLDESIPLIGWVGVGVVMAGLVLVGRGASSVGRTTG